MIDRDIKNEIIEKFNGYNAKSIYQKFKEHIDILYQEYNVNNTSEAIYILINYDNRKCNYGKDRKFLGFNKGYGFCGKRGKCQCASDEQSQRSKYMHNKTKELPSEFKPLTDSIISQIKEDCDKGGIQNTTPLFNKYKEYLGKYIDQIMHKEIKLSEVFYQIVYGNPEKCKYGEFPVFNTYETGYKQFCGSGKKCKCKIDHISHINTEHHKNKTEEDYTRIREKREKTSIKNYGVKNPMKSAIIKDKHKKSIIGKYGVEYYSQSNEYNKKVKKTSLEKYGVDHPLKSEKIKERIKNTNIEKYGSQMKQARQKSEEIYNGNVFASDWFKENREELYKKSFGESHPMKSQKVINKMKVKNLSKYGSEIANRAHLTELGKKVLDNKELLKEYIEKYTVYELQSIFNCESTVIYRTIKKFSLTLPLRTNTSSYELIIKNILENNNIYFIHGDRKILDGKELDFYIPSANLAIEVNGLYWHSDKIITNNTYHYDKWKQCHDKGIQLLTIFEDEFIDRQNTWISKILHICNQSKERIYARKCVVAELDKDEIYNFVEKYHLQGFANSMYYYGAFYDGELVAMMSFTNTRNNKEIQMNRFCLKNGVIISGIANRLLKAFVTDHNINEVVTYSDNRYSNGGIYREMGFEMVNEIRPDYSYVKGIKRFHKSGFKKSKISSKFGINMSNKTEREAMEELGFSRIYDCGKIKWKWTKSY